MTQDYARFIFPIIRRHCENRYRIDHYSNVRKTFVVDMLYMIDSKSDSEELKYSIIKNREPKSLKEGWSITNAIDVSQSMATGGMNCKKCNTFNEYVTTPNQLDNSYVCMLWMSFRILTMFVFILYQTWSFLIST